MNKLSLLIFSSHEALNVARAIKAELDFDMNVTIWNQNVFSLSQYPLESIIEKLNDTDFASFVFIPNDIASINGKETKVVRDNVIFEFGLSIGKLGRERVSFVIPRDSDFHIPTDLAGITPGLFDYSNTNLLASVGTYCEQIRSQADRLKITFPIKGKYGDNLFYKSILKVKGTSSFLASIPRGKKVTIKIERINNASYVFDVGTGSEWIHFDNRDHDNIQYITAEGPCMADNLFRVIQSGIIHIDAFEDDESFPLFKKDVEIEP